MRRAVQILISVHGWSSSLALGGTCCPPRELRSLFKLLDHADYDEVLAVVVCTTEEHAQAITDAARHLANQHCRHSTSSGAKEWAAWVRENTRWGKRYQWMKNKVVDPANPVVSGEPSFDDVSYGKVMQHWRDIWSVRRSHPRPAAHQCGRHSTTWSTSTHYCATAVASLCLTPGEQGCGMGSLVT
eukprot:464571-Amphidinium_carterae.1